MILATPSVKTQYAVVASPKIHQEGTLRDAKRAHPRSEVSRLGNRILFRTFPPVIRILLLLATLIQHMLSKTLSQVMQGARMEEQELAGVAEETRKPEQKQVGNTKWLW